MANALSKNENNKKKNQNFSCKQNNYVCTLEYHNSWGQPLLYSSSMLEFAMQANQMCCLPIGWSNSYQLQCHASDTICSPPLCQCFGMAYTLQCYYPFKRKAEYIFSPGCLSMMSRSILRLWLPGPLQVLFLLEIVRNSLKQAIQTIINLKIKTFIFDSFVLIQLG